MPAGDAAAKLRATIIMRRAIFIGWFFAGLLFVLPNSGQAEDLTTLSGVTYANVRLTRVEPDGLTYMHSLGVCKLAFTDLPESLRRAYNFDPQRAAAYTKESAERAAARAARDRQLIEAAEATRLATATARATNPAASPAGTNGSAANANAPTTVTGASFTYGAERSVDRLTEQAIRSVSAQVDAARQQEAIKNAPTVWDAKLWRYVPFGLVDGRGREEFLLPSYLRRENAALDGTGPRETPASR